MEAERDIKKIRNEKEEIIMKRREYFLGLKVIHIFPL
jgi:hypothetical protein